MAISNSEARVTPNAIIGQLDLQNKRMMEAGPFDLSGEWEFYWQDFLHSDDVEHRSAETVYVPDTWSNYRLNGESLSKNGHATYRLSLLLNEEDIGETLSLYMPSIATAYCLFVNGKLLATVGSIGESREQMVPDSRSQIVTFELKEPKIELLLQVSNFHQRKAGLWETIRLGTVDQIAELRERNIFYQSFVIGCIFIIGFYHLVMFFHRPKDFSPLFLAMACFGVALRTSLLKDKLMMHLLPNLDWEVATSLEYISALMALLFFLLFVNHELSVDIPFRFMKWFISFIMLYSIFVIVTPASIFTNTYIIYQLLFFVVMLTIVIISFKGVRRKYEGAYLSFIAILVLFTAVLNDIFYYSNRISTDEFVSVGLLFYLFTQSVHLARKSSRSFDHVEQLSEELQKLNHSLEVKVEKRTAQLQEANQNLKKIEQSRRRLFASVSHELNTPLTFIQGYIKAMIDGVISKDDSTYLRTIYSDTQMMSHMIHDLQELSKLESGQVSLQFKHIEISSLVAMIYEEQKTMIEKKGFEFHYHHNIDKKTICLIDPVRIKQVIINLLINAQKYTSRGGNITIKLESLWDREIVKISVIDTGTGIEHKDLPYIFERFYKVNKVKNGVKQGAGLGLAIVKEIIENHNGSVGVTSKIGKGSNFYFTLPIQKNVTGGS